MRCPVCFLRTIDKLFEHHLLVYHNIKNVNISEYYVFGK